MKIGSKLTLRYIGTTAAISSLVILAIYSFARNLRERTFYNYLTREAITKANLFLSGKIDRETMHLLYDNNRIFMDEAEVAIYTTNFRKLYHDDKDIDIVKETPQLLNDIIQNKEVEFYIGKYQVIGRVYTYEGTEYILTSAAYARYGYARMEALSTLLFFAWLGGMATLTVVGWWLARNALAPVGRINKEISRITGSNLNARLRVNNPKDELGKLSTAFNQMLDRVGKSLDDQKLFVGQIAHELRTPLAALITELEVSLLREERSGPEYRAAIGNAVDDARILNRLITDLLDLAKADFRPEEIVMEDIRLDELLLDAREIVQKAFPNYAVELVFDHDLDDERKITVFGNEYLLRIAFTNLIENNCKFSENHTSHVHISFEGAMSVVTFSDTGVGMSSIDVDKIFGPFYRGENAAQAKGHGLGMPLAQKIVKLHNGSIAVQSRIAVGTVFTVGIPHI